MLKNNKFALTIIGIALGIKLFLFVYMSIFSPQGGILPDSADYLNTASTLASRGVFGQLNNGIMQYETYRTPGYSLFLCVFHYLMKIPLQGIVFLQLLLAVGAGFITYWAAFEIDKKTAFLSATIVLYSLPVTTSALLILSDTLYLFLLSLFMLIFIRYLKNQKTKLVIFSALVLALATYVRPVSYYLGIPAAAFILYANFIKNFPKAILQAVLFFLVVYGLLGIWQLRNHAYIQRYLFTGMQQDYSAFIPFKSYALDNFPGAKGSLPIFSYLRAAGHCFLSLAGPGTLKYLHCHFLNVAAKIFGYLFIAFWSAGFLVGLLKLKSSIFYQFVLLVILYLVFITIAATTTACGVRYVVPIVPWLALISAAGWIKFNRG